MEARNWRTQLPKDYRFITLYNTMYAMSRSFVAGHSVRLPWPDIKALILKNAHKFLFESRNKEEYESRLLTMLFKLTNGRVRPTYSLYSTPNPDVSGSFSVDSNDPKDPIQRLTEAVEAMSEKALSASVTEIASVMCNENLTGCSSTSIRMLSMDTISSLQSELITNSGFTSPRIEINRALLKEINEVNQILVNTVVEISDENAISRSLNEGTIVKCTFRDVAIVPKASTISSIQPLQLLVPANYPNSSPMLPETLPVAFRKEEHEAISKKVKLWFNMRLRQESEPFSVGKIARIWDACIRAAIYHHGMQIGGGNVFSKYGTWEKCL